ncbi:MAG: TrkH family potassium uptake protein [Gammaproteobacteria bacterium]
MSDRSAGLANAVRPRVVAKYLGQLLLNLAFLSLPPLLVSIFFREWVFTFRLVAVVGFCLVCFYLSARVPEPGKIQSNEALTVIAMIFVLSALLMTYPLMSAGLEPLDALFESVSAVTTTGLSTVTGLARKPESFLFTRAWMQWYGGLGIVVFSVALMAHHHIAARRLTGAANSDNLMTSARVHARQVLLVYVILTGFGLAVSWLILGDGFTALLHVLAAVSTGGFSPFDNSLNGIPGSGGRFVVMAFSFLGAVPLPLFYLLWRNGFGQFARDVELNAYLVAVLTTSGLLFLILDPVADHRIEALENAVLMGISAQSTTGFASLDVLSLPPAALLVLVFSMFIGGCVGSTGGGAKILRVLICGRQLLHSLLLTALPSHAVAEPKIGDRTLHNDESIRALLLLILFAAVIAISWLIFVACGYAPMSALFEVCSATATAGLSSGITRSGLESGLKVVLCFDMLLGRLEIIALLVLCYPRTWLERREAS